MRVVLDTNILIAAFIARGVCSDLLEHCIREHEIITSEFILNEFREQLLGKFKYAVAQADAATELLRSKMVVTTPIPLDAPVCRDADDDMILATALTASAPCIVTGDKDLLDIQQFQTVDIIRPRDFANYETTHPADTD